ncbi:hypothetical protein TW80_16595 [Loktanella sp. S4079]|nr:hypothetical protein TW80_16595 [Loktanella sp. S4079]
MNDETTSIVQSVLQVEAEALLRLTRETPPEIAKAIYAIHESTGPLIVAGVGKSGHIARKVASTFRSLGKRAAFLHAAEASHGDLGIIHDDSIVLVLSNSGETTELADLLAYCREYRIPVISITATEESTLARSSTITIAHGKVSEACINGLAPTTSTTVALAIGDALAVGFSHLLKSAPADFRRYHPGGKLGSRLLTARDLMLTGDRLPIVLPNTPMHDVVITMSSKGLGVALVIDGDKTLGLITDGDMRRNVERLWASQASDLLTGTKPVSIALMATASEALKEMTSRGITCLVVHDESEKISGLLHIHDCLRAGVE